MTISGISVLVFDEDATRGAATAEALRHAGCDIPAVLQECDGVGRRIADLDPDALMINLGNGSSELRDGFFQLGHALQKPIALFIDSTDAVATKAAIEAGISAYIVDGFALQRVPFVLELAVNRFAEADRVARELEEAKSALLDRKLIDKAKGIVMRTKDMGEEEAYGLLRNAAMNQNRKIRDVAESLILSNDLLG